MDLKRYFISGCLGDCVWCIVAWTWHGSCGRKICEYFDVVCYYGDTYTPKHTHTHSLSLSLTLSLSLPSSLLPSLPSSLPTASMSDEYVAMHSYSLNGANPVDTTITPYSNQTTLTATVIVHEPATSNEDNQGL